MRWWAAEEANTLVRETVRAFTHRELLDRVILNRRLLTVDLQASDSL